MSLLISVRAELIKSKRTAPFYLTFAAAAFSPLMLMLEIFFDDGIAAKDRNIIFNKVMTYEFIAQAAVVFPLFVILICTLLPQIEYRNNAWKQVLTAPRTKANTFLSKLIHIQLLLLLFLITDVLVMFLCSFILHFKEPSLNILQQPVNGYQILMARLNAYIVLQAICSIQFWLGIRFRNFIIPIAIGLAGWFAGTILVLKEVSMAAYFPYSLHAWGNFPDYNPLVNVAGWKSMAFAALFLVIGFWDFNKRRSAS